MTKADSLPCSLPCGGLCENYQCFYHWLVISLHQSCRNLPGLEPPGYTGLQRPEPQGSSSSWTWATRLQVCLDLSRRVRSLHALEPQVCRSSWTWATRFQVCLDLSRRVRSLHPLEPEVFRSSWTRATRFQVCLDLSRRVTGLHGLELIALHGLELVALRGLEPLTCWSSWTWAK